MDATTLTLIWILVVGVIVGLVVWLGPRPSQWRQEEPDEAVGDQPEDDPNPPLT